MKTAALLTSVLAIAAAACTSTVESEPAPEPGPQADPGLFACELAPSCAAICSHLGVGDCSAPDALACSGSVWLHGGPGVLVLEDRPGPGGWEGDKLVILMGDDTALVTSRERSCPSGETLCDMESQPWAFEPAQRCEVADPRSDGGCHPGAGECAAFPALDACVPAEPAPTCEDVEALFNDG